MTKIPSVLLLLTLIAGLVGAVSGQQSAAGFQRSAISGQQQEATGTPTPHFEIRNPNFEFLFLPRVYQAPYQAPPTPGASPTPSPTTTALAWPTATPRATYTPGSPPTPDVSPTPGPSPTPGGLPPPQGPTIFGLNTKSTMMKLSDLPEREFTWGRPLPIFWDELEPKKGERNWAGVSPEVEAELRFAAERGIRLTVIVAGTPRWAQQYPPYNYCGPIKRAELPAFANFMGDLVARYSRPPYNVHHWELWNEPDVDHEYSGTADYGCWGDDDDPYFGGGYYAEMLKAIYPAVKAADPQAQVLVGGLLLLCDHRTMAGVCQERATFPTKFLEGILRGGGAPYFDGVAFHAFDGWGGEVGVYGNANWGSAYNTSGPVIVTKARFLKEVLIRYGATDKRLLMTEGALRCHASTCGAEFEASKAYYVTQLYAAAVAEGLEAAEWYCAYCGWTYVDYFRKDRTTFPAYTAFRVAWNKLGEADFIRELATGRLKGYEFERAGRRLWVAWAVDGEAHVVDLPGTVLSAVDALGEAAPVTGRSVTVGVKPVYVEWAP